MGEPSPGADTGFKWGARFLSEQKKSRFRNQKTRSGGKKIL